MICRKNTSNRPKLEAANSGEVFDGTTSEKGTIFISLDNEEVYQVSGIISSWEEMFYGASMPLVIEATFMPFRDVIISDGLVMPYNILVGGGMKRMLKDAYMAAKKSGQVHQTL